MKIIALSIFAVLTMTVSAQTTLKLKSGDHSLSAELINRTFDNNQTINGAIYKIVSFATIPTNEDKQSLLSQGVELLSYLPENSFFVRFHSSAALANYTGDVFEILPEYKKSKDLSEGVYPAHAVDATGTEVLVYVHYFEGLQLNDLNLGSFKVITTNPELNMITLQVPIIQLDLLLNTPGIFYVGCIENPGEPENKVGRSNHRSNSLRSEYANGIFYRGENVTVMMQDDGIIGDHIDFEGRNNQSGCAGCSTSPNNSHGDHVAGTIMGAGNLDPKGRGMADGARLLVYGSSNSNYDQVPNLYNNDSLVITSKSYSSGCNSGYDSRARQLDQQIRMYPSLTHVFSAGNDGGSDCGYGAGSGWGNITGGHKSGKNVIAVGNLNLYDNLASSSSRGPATDGRIKPDICGVGTSVFSTYPDFTYASISGTSMSCPGVAGTIAQLYEAYRADFGMNPDGALIKACILNTGEDLGNPGPDFKHGWGRINGRRAYNTFHDNQFQYDSVAQGGLNTHSILVPSGITELRIMVYWADYEGTVNASPALVNNLDMVVTDPLAVNYQPWVLDPTPTVGALNSNAVQGIDNLNNMEQVTIQNPASGTYNVSITGTAIPQGPQDYYIVYYFVRDEITVTYPNGGEPFEVNSAEIIRWDAEKNIGNFTVEYSTDNGTTWTSAGTVLPDRLYYSWSVPNTVTGQAKIRVTRGAVSDESDEVFSMIAVPNNLDVAWSCPDSLNVVWDAVPGATSYEVSMLGVKYMDSVGTSLVNNLTLPIPSTDDVWLSVKALGPNNCVGERAVAIRKTPGEFECLWSTPTAQFSIDCDNPGPGYCLNMINESQNANATSDYTWYFPGGNPATSTDQFPTVCYPTDGDYDVALVVDNGFDTDSVYITSAITVVPAMALPYHEGFESQFSFINNNRWSISNPDNNGQFNVTTLAALSGSKSAYINNATQLGNYEDELISGPIDLSTLLATDDVTLSFRYSYKKRMSSNDEWLKVFIQGDCSGAWVQRKTIHGDQLSNQTQLSQWVPTDSSHWTTVHVTNITSTYYTSDFRFKFRFESDYGNNFYLDDINIYQGGSSDDVISGLDELSISSLNVYPNPTAGELNFSYVLNTSENTTLRLFDVTGKLVKTVTVISQPGHNLIVLDTAGLAEGMYHAELEAKGSSHVTRVIVQRQ